MEMPYLGAQYRPRMFAQGGVPLAQPQMFVGVPQQGGMFAPPSAGMGGGGAGGGGGMMGGGGAGGGSPNMSPQPFGGGWDATEDQGPSMGEYTPPRIQDVMNVPGWMYGAPKAPTLQQQLRASDAIAKGIAGWSPNESSGYATTKNTQTAPETNPGGPGARVAGNSMIAPAPRSAVNPTAAGSGGMLDRIGGMLNTLGSFTPTGMAASMLGKPLAGFAPFQSSPVTTSDVTNSGWSLYEDPNTFKTNNTQTAPQSPYPSVDVEQQMIESDPAYQEWLANGGDQSITSDPAYEEWLASQLDQGGW